MMGRHFGLALPRFGIDLVGLKSACDRAVRLIDDGTDLRRFSENPELARTRERITAKLRTHLIGPQRNRVRVRPEPQSACDWGDRRDRGD
jgi:hypothetical protein